MSTTEDEVEIPRPKRGEGQWGLGFFEPLNPAERIKRDDPPLNVRQRVLDIYSQKGFRSIDPQNLRSRLRWYGLYTQRKQGVPGGANNRQVDVPHAAGRGVARTEGDGA